MNETSRTAGYLEQARAARARAEIAITPHVAAIHMEMHNRYMALAYGQSVATRVDDGQRRG